MIKLHLVSWNRPKMTELVIKTIKRNTTPGSYKLIVWDNGSDQETVDMLKRLEGEYIHQVIYNPENVGLERARQELLYTTLENGDKYIVCIDNDCLPPEVDEGKDWFDKLLELMERHPDFAAISMRTQVMIGTGNIFEHADMNGDDIVEFPHPGGSFRIMDVVPLLGVGGWARESGGRGAEERYIGGKLNEAGYRTAFATNIQCLHLFGTRDENGTDRWGYDKDLKPEDTGHSDIFHPALQNGDDQGEIRKYSGEKLTEEYIC